MSLHPVSGTIAGCVALRIHSPTLAEIAPYLDEGATIVALPARSGFDLQARELLHPFSTSRSRLPRAALRRKSSSGMAPLGTRAPGDADRGDCPQATGIAGLAARAAPALTRRSPQFSTRRRVVRFLLGGGC